ncbi:dihydropteroate synthase [Amycolatopsis sp. Hca4]|uniref:dihydropteroate synthase n=1 Tax=unclassified Amycolatopsis TaxID=2618356 RepID=UPI00159235BA|nr:dihydropteroate synthase [Amycolatopsis sp. Hca4]QKV78650.1 dihydropteroate synthase [Amycolatopsis sp. Hca4]
MKTPDLVFRGRRLSRDRALVLAAVESLPAARDAVADGADLVSFAGAGAESLVEQARSAFPDLVIGVDTADPSVAAACCEAGADLIVTSADLSEVAARYDAGYAAPSLVAGLSVAVDIGDFRSMPAEDVPVLASVAEDGTPAGLARAALAASAGVAIIRTKHVRQVRQVAEMAASIAGTRPPAKAVRWE